MAQYAVFEPERQQEAISIMEFNSQQFAVDKLYVVQRGIFQCSQAKIAAIEGATTKYII